MAAAEVNNSIPSSCQHSWRGAQHETHTARSSERGAGEQHNGLFTLQSCCPGDIIGVASGIKTSEVEAN